ncbi:MAG: OsmC family protein [Bryobacteraceae bacterium]|nr:OsmC family protein [Bryobacteraceae bacterium]
MARHEYKVQVAWSGNDGVGTRTYSEYRRDHTIHIAGKPVLPGSSDPAFRGDAARYNPEELLVASLSACHMLSYLHLCANAGVVVTAYQDDASGAMELKPDGSGAFTEATLRPRVTLDARSDPVRAQALHHEAHQRCFIAASVNFPVYIEAEIETPPTSE